MSCEQEINQLKSEISSQLRSSAISYLKMAKEHFHRTSSKNWYDFQGIIGAFCISIELILKSTIAHFSLRDLYVDLPKEAKLYLSNFEIVPDAKSFNKYKLDLKLFHYKTMEFDACVGCFYVIYPELKQFYRPYFKYITKIRNLSVHAALPNFQRYDLLRIAFVAIKLFKELKEKELIPRYNIIEHEKDEKFLSEYNDDQIKHVQKKIEQARANVKSMDYYWTMRLSTDVHWDYFQYDCPICDSEADLYGTTDLEVGEEYDGQADMYLQFFADGFECTECGLVLEDVNELQLAGIEIVHERDSDLEKWLKEHDPQMF